MIVNGFNIPENLYYTEQHEWALIENSNSVKIGVTDYAQKSLHEIVFVETPKEGRIIKKMEAIGTVESVKSVSEVFSPLSGYVRVVNKKLEMSPELINKDPYGDGWIIVLEPTALKDELSELLTANQYSNYLTKIVEKNREPKN